MLKIRLSLLVLAICLAFASGAEAQYRWHIVQHYPGVTSISCSGDNCTAIIVDTCSIYYSASYTIYDVDSNVIIHSTDGGLTWAAGDSVPQWKYDSTGRTRLLYSSVQQIDSLDAIAVDEEAGVIVRTFDGWKTIRIDSSFNNYPSFYGIKFANVAEGMINEGFSYLSTIDTGNHWTPVTFQGPAAYHSYGMGMFRVFHPPEYIYTTHNNWSTNDTATFTLSDSLLNPQVIPQMLVFGGNDSLAVLALYKTGGIATRYSVMLASSSDLGKQWSVLPLPTTVAMNPQFVTPIDQQIIVIAGIDPLGQIIITTDHGATWKLETVPLDNGMPYNEINSVAITGSGRVIASIILDSSNGDVLAYLEPSSSSVEEPKTMQSNLAVYPNPASGTITVANSESLVAILDPLGRTYEAKRTGNTLDVSALPSGVYFISDGHSRAKFVKE